MSGQTTGNSGATSQLAANGYRIAKSWQYQDANLPNQNQRENRPLNNNTLRPILMANYPPIASPNRSAFAGLKRDRQRVRRKDSSIDRSPKSETQKQPLLLNSEWHRKSDDEEMSGGARCCFGFLTFLAQILLHGVVGLVLYWVIAYHHKDNVPFSWRTGTDTDWNLHPVLMILGFIYFMGQAMLMYRTCRCCRRIWSKLLHTIFHLLAAPCIAIGFIATWDHHNLRTDNDGNPSPIPNFYSLHSWMGLTTMGLFALQFIVGFFSFLLLLCCESATASFRAALVPIHSTFGITTFVMAVATSCTGLIEKAFFTLSLSYFNWVPFFMDPNYNRTQALRPTGEKIKYEVFSSVPDFVSESLVVNCLGAAMVALVVIMPILVLHPKFRSRPQRIITVTHDRYG